jgi:hypothetical protein
VFFLLGLYTFVFCTGCFSRKWAGFFVGFLKDQYHSTGVRGFFGLFLFLAKVIHFSRFIFSEFFPGVFILLSWRESGGGCDEGKIKQGRKL